MDKGITDPHNPVCTLVLPLHQGDAEFMETYDVGLVSLTQRHLDSLLQLKHIVGAVMWMVETVYPAPRPGFELSFFDYSFVPYSDDQMPEEYQELEEPRIVDGDVPVPEGLSTEYNRLLVSGDGLQWTFYPKHTNHLVASDTVRWDTLEAWAAGARL